MSDQPKPRQPIRRFDVFAEYNKLAQLAQGHPLDEAKGYGLWLAKVVASRRFQAAGTGKAATEGKAGERAKSAGAATEPPERFRSLNDQPQTDKLFDDEIVARMGPAFYHDVFAPAIADAFARGQRYEAIRDSIRKAWSASKEHS